MKKKLFIFILVIIGVGGYWLSQNTWVFEKQIAVEDYEEFLADTEWKVPERNSTWSFKANNVYKVSHENSDYNQNGTWKIEDKTIIVETDELGYSEWFIKMTFKNNIYIQLIRPNVGLGGLNLK
jgi:hypothetical protein